MDSVFPDLPQNAFVVRMKRYLRFEQQETVAPNQKVIDPATPVIGGRADGSKPERFVGWDAVVVTIPLLNDPFAPINGQAVWNLSSH